jgi:hypothetical protein
MAEATADSEGPSLAEQTEHAISILRSENEDLQRRLKDQVAAVKSKVSTIVTLEVSQQGNLFSCGSTRGDR